MTSEHQFNATLNLCNIVSYIRINLMGINQCLMSLACMISWFKLQQKIGALLMPETMISNHSFRFETIF